MLFLDRSLYSNYITGEVKVDVELTKGMICIKGPTFHICSDAQLISRARGGMASKAGFLETG